MQKKTSRGLEGDDKIFFRNVKDMEELSDLIGIKRTQRGSIDFDLPEPEIIIGLSGNMEDIIKRERNKAHKLIEEFMIAANEAVATFLSLKEIPTLYRVHDTPDTQKVLDFIRFAQTLGFNVKIEDEVTPAWCQQVLKMVVNLPQEYIINSILLRSMQQAVYSPDNIGHFGLASSFYLHFTSPIRRYPDLVTHRVLRGFIETKKKVYQHEELKKIGENTSSLERKAMEAEREMVERLKVRFMEDKVGAEFDGVISGVASFGFFVELKDVFVEGAVRLVDLADDYYVYDVENYRLFGQNTKKIFQIGMPVRVRLKGVNIKRRHVNFEVAQ
jgi:ribonuclease R